MSKHRISTGVRIIENISRLGEILAYHVETEHLVETELNSAVDVAWISERGQQYPLFIFEIESATTNSIFANPGKIFGTSNLQFEKPLFLFHILLTGGQESGKVQQLQNLFGTHNYRIYRFSLEEQSSLICDILNQHRRLSRTVNIKALITELISNWESINIMEIVSHIEKLNFVSSEYLPTYAQLSQSYPEFKICFMKLLKEQMDNSEEKYLHSNYDSYNGNEWPFPIYYGLLASYYPQEGMEYFLKFKKWQEETQALKQIGPYFGLSRDYDIFILGLSGSLLALSAFLFSSITEARDYIAEQLYIISADSKFPVETRFFNLIWLLYACPNTSTGKKYYDFARNTINEVGGAPENLYQMPPNDYLEYLESDIELNSYGKNMMIQEWESVYSLKDILPESELLYQLGIDYLFEKETCNPVKYGNMK